ncbi:MAG: hypothetical protein ACRCX2_30060 [Paraclostridium sp.]
MIKKKEKKTETITFRTTTENKIDLAKIAAKYEVTISDLINQIINDYINGENH